MRHWNARLIGMAAVIAGLLGPAEPACSQTFLYEEPILEQAVIDKMTNEALLATYINVAIEVKTATLFHEAGGFAPKEFKVYKQMLRYRYNLMEELKERELEVPDINP